MQVTLIKDLNTVRIDSRLYLTNVIDTVPVSTLRRFGFTVVSDINTADYIVERIKKNNYSGDIKPDENNKVDLDILQSYSASYGESFPVDCKIIREVDLLKFIKSAPFSMENYETIDNFFKSDDYKNSRIALNLMINIDWSGNELFLNELLNKHYSRCIAGTSFRNHVTAKCFMSEIHHYSKRETYLDDINDYVRKKLIQSQHHVDFVFNKYTNQFQDELNALLGKYFLKSNKVVLDIKSFQITDLEEWNPEYSEKTNLHIEDLTINTDVSKQKQHKNS